MKIATIRCAIVVTVFILSSSVYTDAGEPEGVVTRPRGTRVTASKIWKCPKCGSVLEKGNLGRVWKVGDSISRVAGTATCLHCMSKFDQADVYGGMYDIEDKVEQEQLGDFEGTVSVIAYQLSSTTMPNNAKQICEDLLKQRYPKATLGKFYCIGWRDAELSPEEGLALYKEHVQKGVLSDLGEQFDTLRGKDISANQVLVLFFKK